MNNPETADKSGYYHINDNQWTFCIPTCASVGGGWRRLNISSGDDCPSAGWRKHTHSGVGFCR